MSSDPFNSGYNHQLALRRPEVVTEKLQKEGSAGRLAWPFVQPPFTNCQVLPIALVETKKKGTYRLIHNLCYPEGCLINNHISKEKGTVRSQRIDDTIDTIIKLGTGCGLSKIDFQHAYKILTIHTNDVSKLRMWWNSSF